MNSNTDKIPPLVEKYDDVTEHRKDIYCIDIDGTLTEPHEGTPWEAVPRPKRIEYVNELYDEGATIYLATARGFIRSTAMHGNDITSAQNEADERVLAKDHIKRSRGIGWFVIDKVRETKEKPVGGVCGS